MPEGCGSGAGSVASLGTRRLVCSLVAVLPDDWRKAAARVVADGAVAIVQLAPYGCESPCIAIRRYTGF